MSFGEKLSEAIKKSGYTNESLADAITAQGRQISKESIAKYRQGKRTPDPELIGIISSLLGVPEQDLFDPSKRERIAREEIERAPDRYLGYLGYLQPHGAVRAEIMSATAAAGTGNNVESIDEFSTGEYAVMDARLFKTPPRDLRLMKVDGYSMTPMLFPDSWVAYEPCEEYRTDGLYVINYGNELMVKLLQYNPAENLLEIISKNPDYKSYKVRPDDQSVFRIVGRVLRCIV